jgi:serine/threonine-protein kinase
MLPEVAPERYKIIRLIGRGGMGSVYRALDTRLEREVALKVLLPPTFEADDSAQSESNSVKRLIREARAVAALEHPNIVAIHDVGEMPMRDGEESTYFIVMELVEGQSLRDFIGRRDVALETRVSWLTDVARALAFAHQRGIIHRDIKPENVMIRSDGVVKVLDFGLARRAAGMAAQAGSAALPTLTGRGEVVGTVLYMSPEQMCGSELDGRADQFSWGVMAYELLGGEPPWPGWADSILIVAQVLTREPTPVSALDTALPPALGKVVDRAIARNRDDRFPSMSAVVDALAMATASSPSEKISDAPHILPGEARVSSAPAAPGTGSSEAAPREMAAAPSGPSRARVVGETASAAPSASAPAARSASLLSTWWRRTRSRWRVGALALAAVGAAAPLGIAWLGRVHQREAMSTPSCAEDVDCGAGRVCAAGACVARSGCRSNTECTKAVGAPAICRAQTGACVALASDDCHPVAEDSDLRDDATVWFGAMFPLSGDDARSFGDREFRAVDLARSDFAYMLRGMHAGVGSRSTRPLAIVACDDAVDPPRAARHLVDDLGVPAIIGFRTSKEVIDLATSMFIPRGVLTLAALNTSPVITRLPRAPDQPRMIFRTTYSSAEAAEAIGRLVPEVLEPEIRGAPGAVHGGEPLRVALVRQDDAAGIGFGEAVFRALSFNGRSALENEASYRELTYPFDTGDDEASFARVVDQLVAFAPHVVIHFGADEALLSVIEPLERRWKAPRFRPRYVKPTVLGPDVLAFVAGRAERRRRFFSVTSTSMTAANARFVTRYSAAYGGNVTRSFSPNSSYDAFYLLAYATYALGREPVSGPALARMFGRLMPRGEPIDVGPNGIFDALNTLAAGENIDLNGATGRLDFDLESGEAPIDLAILCVKMEGDGADNVESGLTYDASAAVLRGAMRCP